MKKGQIITYEAWAIANAKPGTVFYSDKQDREITAIASNHKRKITTERLVIVTSAKAEPKANYITKITVL